MMGLKKERRSSISRFPVLVADNYTLEKAKQISGATISDPKLRELFIETFKENRKLLKRLEKL